MRSAEFDDIYFSAEDGLAETRHTFLDGNNLPAAWAGKGRFCICETGFGTGLNMLAAWRLYEETTAPHQRLDLISIEKHPLDAAQIRAALTPWNLEPHLTRLLHAYPLRLRGFHRLNLTPRVSLTLVFDDVLTALPQLSARVDAWFLDGFAPAKNPAMWSDVLYKNMARLSNAGASAATFTAAGDVRRGLAAAGFDVAKRPGFGRKRDMVVARFTGAGAPAAPQPPGHVAIIGAGLAGLSAAWHLKREGINVTVYDAGDIASGASGNTLGLLNPKLTAKPSPQADYYTSAYAYARHMLHALPGAGYNPCGSLHLELDADRARRFAGYVQNLGWHENHMRLLDAPAASDAAGVALNVPCLHYPDAGSASPRGLCAALAQDVDVRPHTRITDVSPFETVILANAGAVRDFADIPVETVRGQVSTLAPGAVSAQLRAALSYGGYIAPLTGGVHMCGATFQPWGDDPAISADDHTRNRENLAAAVPSIGLLDVTGGWVGFRAASKDRFPVIGHHAGGVHISAAHGSHGMISGLMAGAVLASALAGAPAPLGAATLAALEPGRFKRS